MISQPFPSFQETSPRTAALNAVCRTGIRWPALALLAALTWTCAASTVFAQSTQQSISTVCPKVVKIFGAGGGRNLQAYGTGFLVSPNGHIVTIWSHILDGDSVTVVLDDGRRYIGKLIGAEPPLDMAILKIDAENLPFFDLSESSSAGPGTRVLAFSNVFKVATGDEPVTVMHGVISARTSLTARRGAFESPYTGPVYVVDAVTNNPGAAGGVLTTWDGRLLGMIGKELRNSQTNTWINYVMPITELKETIDQIITGNFTRKRPGDDEEMPADSPRRYEPRDFGIVTIPDVLPRTPAYIDRVLPGSQAQKAGLMPNDLILFSGDTLIQSCRVLKEDLGRREANDPIKLVVRRGDVLITVELVAPRKSDE